LPARPRTNDNFGEECEAFAALPATADPVQEDLTWYVLKEGIGLIDWDARQVKRFTELLDETHFVVAAMAFGKDKVWVGTNKGLFAWDRKDMFWTRFAVGGKFVDLPVKDLSLGADAKLHVTSQTAGDTLREFLYDAKTGVWTRAH
jgi:ligand-binding sensor domain-containing protein